jgi:hypothetical protein
MASKKYKGKTCAYCCREGASAVKEHVIAREFLLERYRDQLPIVPACNPCNTKKSALETYALTVLPFGSTLPHGSEYIRNNMERRLAKHPTLRRELGSGSSREWISQNGVMVSVMTMPLDHERINRLVALIVRGLFNYEFGFALHRHWDVRVTNFLPAAEVELMPTMIRALGPKPHRRERIVGDGTVKYTAWRSRWLKYCSIWRPSLFGGLQVGGDEEFPTLAFDYWSAATFRNENAPVPLDDDEKPDLVDRGRTSPRLRRIDGRSCGALCAPVGEPQRQERPLRPNLREYRRGVSCVRSTVAEAIKALEDAGIMSWTQRIKRVRERCSDLLGDNGWRWRVLRTSNAYNFRDPGGPSPLAGEGGVPVLTGYIGDGIDRRHG